MDRTNTSTKYIINTFYEIQNQYSSWMQTAPFINSSTFGLKSYRLTSLLVQHNQSPDAGIFALFPKDSHMNSRGGEINEIEVSYEATTAGRISSFWKIKATVYKN